MPYSNLEKRKQFHKEYYLKNKSRALELAKTRYLANAEEIKEYAKNYYQNNKERHNKLSKIYREKNYEKVLMFNKKWMEENEKTYKAWKKEWSKEYAKNNRHLIYARDTKRRQLKKESIDKTTDFNKIKQFYLLAETLSKNLGKKYVVDHIKPIALGGAHHQDNLQVITMVDNLKKGAKYPFPVEERYLPDFNPSVNWIIRV